MTSQTPQLPKPLYGSTGGQHSLARWVDHRETYGPHVIRRFLATLPGITSAIDVGAGHGRDLALIKQANPAARTIALEASTVSAEILRDKADEVYVLDIEKNEFPVAAGSIDLIIANQVLEHTKEIFWIFDQVTSALKVGGHFIFGVPNVASLHNRLLLLLGEQPTQHKLCSAHVRPFSKRDTLRFLETCFPGGYRLTAFGGSQFYPLPGPLARLAANALPTMAMSIFFMIRKEKEYDREFIRYPAAAEFETNFYVGESATVKSQYDVR